MDKPHHENLGDRFELHFQLHSLSEHKSDPSNEEESAGTSSACSGLCFLLYTAIMKSGI